MSKGAIGSGTGSCTERLQELCSTEYWNCGTVYKGVINLASEFRRRSINGARMNEIDWLRAVLNAMKNDGQISIAVLYGSFTKGTQHTRSDIDIAVYLNAQNHEEEIDLSDRILMSVEKDVSILRLDDQEESPFIVQEALKGIHLVEPDKEILYEVSLRVLHETESIRFRRKHTFG